MNTSKIRLLVTGGSGFIGTNAIEYYLGKGADILNLDITAPRNSKHQSLWKEINVCDSVSLRKVILDFDPTHVLHFAATTDFASDMTLKDYQGNVDGIQNLIEILPLCKNLKRAMFASSMLVCAQGYQPKSYEDYTPATLYGTSKVMMEKLIRKKKLNFSWVIIRPASIWGPWFGTPYKEFFLRVMNNTFFKFNGKMATKTFGFVHNAIAQIDKLLLWHDNLVDQRTFYIGDKPALNINTWADAIAKQLDKKLHTLPFFLLGAGGWVGDVLAKAGVHFPLQSFRVRNMTTDNDIALLKETLEIAGESHYTLEQGIAITLQWMKEYNTPR